MLCPTDQTKLIVHQGTKLCPQCGGEFFLDREFEHYLATAERPSDEVIKHHLKSLVVERPQAAGYQTSTGKACPHCDTQMVSQNYGYDSNVFIDRCPACRATWLDHNESTKMLAYLVAGGEFHAVADNITETATRDYFYRAGQISGEATRVYPYNPERTALLGLGGGHPEVVYREYSTLARLVRFPRLYLLAQGLIVLSWAAWMMLQSVLSPSIVAGSSLVLVIAYVALARLSRWGKAQQAIMREAEQRPFERTE